MFVDKVNVARTYSATVTDPGLDEEAFSWSFPATSVVDSPATFTAQCASPCPDPDSDIPVSVTKTATATYLFPGTYTVQVFGTDDEGAASNTDFLPSLVVDGRNCTATSSWWLANYSGAQGRQLRDQQLLAYNDNVRKASQVFGVAAKANPVELKLVSKADAKAILSGTGSRGYAQAAGLAAWLNVFGAGAVSLSEPVPSDGRSAFAVLQEVDSILKNPSSSATQLQRARTLADKINTMRTKCI
jgi:hypothetical protein